MFWLKRKKSKGIWKRLKEEESIAVDVDGTLCTGECFTKEQCLNAKPRLDMIKKVNELGRNKHIIIWTARKSKLLGATEVWLIKHGVVYHAVDNRKNPWGVYIDDRAINAEDFLNSLDVPKGGY